MALLFFWTHQCCEGDMLLVLYTILLRLDPTLQINGIKSMVIDGRQRAISPSRLTDVEYQTANI